MNSDVNDQEEEFDIEDLDDDFDTFEDKSTLCLESGSFSIKEFNISS